MHELMPDVLEGRIEPGLVFDRTTNIDGVPDGYRAMNDREAIKVMIELRMISAGSSRRTMCRAFATDPPRIA